MSIQLITCTTEFLCEKLYPILFTLPIPATFDKWKHPWSALGYLSSFVWVGKRCPLIRLLNWTERVGWRPSPAPELTSTQTSWTWEWPPGRRCATCVRWWRRMTCTRSTAVAKYRWSLAPPIRKPSVQRRMPTFPSHCVVKCKGKGVRNQKVVWPSNYTWFYFSIFRLLGHATFWFLTPFPGQEPLSFPPRSCGVDCQISSELSRLYM